jgi:hypothetical protein
MAVVVQFQVELEAVVAVVLLTALDLISHQFPCQSQ